MLELALGHVTEALVHARMDWLCYGNLWILWRANRRHHAATASRAPRRGWRGWLGWLGWLGWSPWAALRQLVRHPTPGELMASWSQQFWGVPSGRSNPAQPGGPRPKVRTSREAGCPEARWRGLLAPSESALATLGWASFAGGTVPRQVVLRHLWDRVTGAARAAPCLRNPLFWCPTGVKASITASASLAQLRPYTYLTLLHKLVAPRSRSRDRLRSSRKLARCLRHPPAQAPSVFLNPPSSRPLPSSQDGRRGRRISSSGGQQISGGSRRRTSTSGGTLGLHGRQGTHPHLAELLQARARAHPWCLQPNDPARPQDAREADEADAGGVGSGSGGVGTAADGGDGSVSVSGGGGRALPPPPPAGLEGTLRHGLGGRRPPLARAIRREERRHRRHRRQERRYRRDPLRVGLYATVSEAFGNMTGLCFLDTEGLLTAGPLVPDKVLLFSRRPGYRGGPGRPSVRLRPIAFKQTQGTSRRLDLGAHGAAGPSASGARPHPPPFADLLLSDTRATHRHLRALLGVLVPLRALAPGCSGAGAGAGDSAEPQAGVGAYSVRQLHLDQAADVLARWGGRGSGRTHGGEAMLSTSLAAGQRVPCACPLCWHLRVAEAPPGALGRPGPQVHWMAPVPRVQFGHLPNAVARAIDKTCHVVSTLLWPDAPGPAAGGGGGGGGGPRAGVLVSLGHPNLLATRATGVWDGTRVHALTRPVLHAFLSRIWNWTVFEGSVCVCVGVAAPDPSALALLGRRPAALPGGPPDPPQPPAGPTLLVLGPPPDINLVDGTFAGDLALRQQGEAQVGSRVTSGPPSPPGRGGDGGGVSHSGTRPHTGTLVVPRILHSAAIDAAPDADSDADLAAALSRGALASGPYFAVGDSLFGYPFGGLGVPHGAKGAGSSTDESDALVWPAPLVQQVLGSRHDLATSRSATLPSHSSPLPSPLPLPPKPLPHHTPPLGARRPLALPAGVSGLVMPRLVPRPSSVPGPRLGSDHGGDHRAHFAQPPWAAVAPHALCHPAHAAASRRRHPEKAAGTLSGRAGDRAGPPGREDSLGHCLFRDPAPALFAAGRWGAGRARGWGRDPWRRWWRRRPRHRPAVLAHVDHVAVLARAPAPGPGGSADPKPDDDVVVHDDVHVVDDNRVLVVALVAAGAADLVHDLVLARTLGRVCCR